MNGKSCYGLLIDVSGSMKAALGADDCQIKNKYVTRAHSVFTTIFKTMKDDTNETKYQNENDTLFALAFGLASNKKENMHCDLIRLLQYLLTSYRPRAECIKILKNYNIPNPNKYIKTKAITEKVEICEIVGHEPLIKMATDNGAPYTGKYIEKYLDEKQSGFIFLHFHQRPDLLAMMVNDLPDVCKNKAASYGLEYVNDDLSETKDWVDFGLKALLKPITAPVRFVSGSKQSEERSAKKALQKALSLTLSPIYKVNKTRLRKEIIDILDRVSLIYPLQENDDDSVEVKKLIDDIKQYIYGYTPMRQSLIYAHKIFELNRDKRRRLLIISDGISTDGDPLPITTQFKNDNVMIACCFITNENISNPKQLYDRINGSWSDGAKKMFEISSYISNTDSSLSLLLKNGWNLGLSGQSKLFIQANHPDIMEQFCSIINKVGQHNDALMEMIGYYKLDSYIIDKLNNEEAHQQHGGTCYANAVAMGIHLALSRHIGRKETPTCICIGYLRFVVGINNPSEYLETYQLIVWYYDGIHDFYPLREQIKAEYGTKGASTAKVLKAYCNYYRLRCTKYKENVDEAGRRIISERRPLVTTFKLHSKQWAIFTEFFRNNPKGILTKNDLLNMSDQDVENGANKGHAILLVRCSSNCLTFMDSQGPNFADKGFFRVENANVLNKVRFWDVYWEESDLLSYERRAYDNYCHQETLLLLKQAHSMFNDVKYQCPKCNAISNIDEYDGHILEAICPKCRSAFKPNAVDLIRSLYARQMSN